MFLTKKKKSNPFRERKTNSSTKNWYAIKNYLYRVIDASYRKISNLRVLPNLHL